MPAEHQLEMPLQFSVVPTIRRVADGWLVQPAKIEEEAEVSTKRAASILNVSSPTVRELIAQGELRARRKTTRPKSMLLVKLSDVYRYKRNGGN